MKILVAAALALSVGTSSFAYAQSATPAKPATQAETGATPVETTTTKTDDGMTVTETVGEEVKQGTAATGQAVENAGQKIENAAGTVGQKIENAAESTGNAIENTAEKAGDAVTPATQPAATAEAPAATTAPVMGAKFEKPAMAIENFKDVDAMDVPSDVLIGTAVYDAQENNIGEIGDTVLSSDGRTIEGLILDVGGFLGIGEHHVAVSPDSLQVLQDDGGNTRIYVSASEDQLKAEPSYVKPEAAPTTEATETAPAVQPTE